MTEDIEFQSVEAIKDFQEKKLREALDYLAANAVQQRPCSADAQAGILALSTCAGAETNGRVVVFGWLHPIEKGDEMQ